MPGKYQRAVEQLREIKKLYSTVSKVTELRNHSKSVIQIVGSEELKQQFRAMTKFMAHTDETIILDKTSQAIDVAIRAFEFLGMEELDAGNKAKVDRPVVTLVTNPQKQRIAELISKNHYNVKDFIPFSSYPSWYELEYKDSQMLFRFTVKEDNYDYFTYGYTKFNPARTKESIAEYIHFTDTLSNFDKWLRTDLKKYVEAASEKDPWTEIEANPMNSESPFNSDEVIQLDAKLVKFPKELTEYIEAKVSHKIDGLEERLSEQISEVRLLLAQNANRSLVRKVLIGIIVDVFISDPLKKVLGSAMTYLFNWFQDFKLPMPPALGS